MKTRTMASRILVWLLAVALLLHSSHAFSSALRSPVAETLVDFETKKYQPARAQNNTLPPTGSNPTPVGMQSQRKEIFVGLLASYYAFADIFCFKTFDCFASMMTGNLIRCSMAVVDGSWGDAMIRGALVSNYIFGAMMYKFIKHHRKMKVAPTAFVLFGAADVVARFVGRQYSPLVMAIAFGIINADTLGSTGVVVNAATGHMSKFGQGLGDAILERKPLPRATVAFLSSFVPSLLASGLVYRFFVKSSRFPPIGLILGTAYWVLVRWYEGPKQAVGVNSFWSSWIPPQKTLQRM